MHAQYPFNSQNLAKASRFSAILPMAVGSAALSGQQKNASGSKDEFRSRLIDGCICSLQFNRRIWR